MMAPIETPAQNSFDDQVVRPSRCPDSYANVDLLFGRRVQIRHDKELLLLIVQ